MHDAMIPECEQAFKRIDDKLDTLVDNANKINGRYDKHIDESNQYRLKVERHEEIITSFKETKRLINGTLFTAILSLVGFAVAWGVITERLKVIEKISNRIEVLGELKK